MISAPELGRRLRSAREARGLTQAAAAEKAGLHKQTISDLECGRSMPAFGRVVDLVEALGFDPAIVAPEWFPARSGRGRKPVEKTG